MGRFDLTLFLITLFAITLTKAAEAKNVKEVAIEVDGEERKVEWDYTYEDVDAVARTYVRQNSLITQRDETGEEAASAISEALRSQINLEQQPVALAPVLRLASLERPGPSQLQRAETVISLYPGHDAGIAIAVGGVVQCALELERLFDVRYYIPPLNNSSEFHNAWTTALRVVKKDCPGEVPSRFDYGVIVKVGIDMDARTTLHHQLPWIVEELFHVERWTWVDHHEAHARAGFFQSPFRSALIVSYDGGGNDGAFNIYRGRFDKVTRLARLDLNMGQMYNFAASLVEEVSKRPPPCGGIQQNVTDNSQDLDFAGKLMGYAALGTPREELQLAMRELYLKSRAVYGPKANDQSGTIASFSPSMTVPDVIGKAICGENALQGQRDFAASAQEEFTNIILDIVREFSALHKNEGDGNSRKSEDVLGEGLVVAGGCALNVPANQRLHDELLKSGMSISVDPAPNDGGLIIGGVFAVTPPPVRPKGMQYAGFNLWDGDMLDGEARARGAIRLSEVGGVDYLAALLCREDRPIVAVVKGRQEFGPRALGHRSLIAVPDSDQIKERMNRLKFRQFYRPVAPMIADEHLEKVFGRFVSSPYMSMAPEILPEIAAEFPGLTHLDKTARHQSVGRDDEPWVHELLHKVGDRTGLAALINTSFNTRGKPICNTVMDALAMLDELQDLDFVLIEDWLFGKGKT